MKKIFLFIFASFTFIQCASVKSQTASSLTLQKTILETPQTTTLNRPKLVVGIVIDQMRYDYLIKFYSKYGENGFKKLMNDGYNLQNVHYNYIPTYTAVGHASIYTGTTPSNHGIVANDWFDRQQMRSINCVEDSTYSTVGSGSKSGACSPINLKSNTITDQLKLTYPDAKVILLCKEIKDSKRYGVPTVEKISNSLFLVKEVIEKPDKPKQSTISKWRKAKPKQSTISWVDKQQKESEQQEFDSGKDDEWS